MIDIPQMLLMLRRDEAEQKYGSLSERLGLKLWCIGSGSVRRYNFFARLARALQSPFLRDGKIARPIFPLSRWAKERDFPPLAQKSFRERWGTMEARRQSEKTSREDTAE